MQPRCENGSCACGTCADSLPWRIRGMSVCMVELGNTFLRFFLMSTLYTLLWTVSQYQQARSLCLQRTKKKHSTSRLDRYVCIEQKINIVPVGQIIVSAQYQRFKNKHSIPLDQILVSAQYQKKKINIVPFVVSVQYKTLTYYTRRIDRYVCIVRIQNINIVQVGQIVMSAQYVYKTLTQYQQVRSLCLHSNE